MTLKTNHPGAARPKPPSRPKVAPRGEDFLVLEPGRSPRVFDRVDHAVHHWLKRPATHFSPGREVVRMDKDGDTHAREVYVFRGAKVLSRSRNMAGIRDYVSNRIVREVRIRTLFEPRLAPATRQRPERLEGDGPALLTILVYEVGGRPSAGVAECHVVWASFNILKERLRHWRNLWGARLVINGREPRAPGRPAQVGPEHPALNYAAPAEPLSTRHSIVMR